MRHAFRGDNRDLAETAYGTGTVGPGALENKLMHSTLLYRVTKDPSEALQRLSSIDTVSLQSKPLKARYALLKSMALDDAKLRVLAETHDELDFVLVRSIETE